MALDASEPRSTHRRRGPVAAAQGSFPSSAEGVPAQSHMESRGSRLAGLRRPMPSSQAEASPRIASRDPCRTAGAMINTNRRREG